MAANGQLDILFNRSITLQWCSYLRERVMVYKNNRPFAGRLQLIFQPYHTFTGDHGAMHIGSGLVPMNAMLSCVKENCSYPNVSRKVLQPLPTIWNHGSRNDIPGLIKQTNTRFAIRDFFVASKFVISPAKITNCMLSCALSRM